MTAAPAEPGGKILSASCTAASSLACLALASARRARLRRRAGVAILCARA